MTLKAFAGFTAKNKCENDDNKYITRSQKI